MDEKSPLPAAHRPRPWRQAALTFEPEPDDPEDPEDPEELDELEEADEELDESDDPDEPFDELDVEAPFDPEPEPDSALLLLSDPDRESVR